MRICHIIEAAGGGSGQVVMDLAHYATANGHSVTVIYAPLRAWPRFIEVLGQNPLIHLIKQPMQRRVGPHDLLDAWRLYRTLKKAGPFDILHAHSSKAGALTRLAGVLLPYPVKVYTPHGFISLSSASSPLYRWIEWGLSFFCSRIITVSEGERQHALKLGIPVAKLAMIPNGIAPKALLSRTDARQELGLAQGWYVIGFIGRLTTQKNPLLAVKAFALIADQYPSINLCLIGDGDLRSQVEKERDAHACRDRIHLVGAREGGSLMAAFDTVLCSSDYEGMPIVFLEAMLAGLPIISTKVGGTDEAIVEGKTGFVAQDHTAESLAQALRASLSIAPEQRYAMEAVIKQRSTLFSLDALGAKTHALYSELLIDKRSLYADIAPRPLRICHIVEATAGGSARIVTQLIAGSLARGDKVALIYSPTRADQPFLTALETMVDLQRIALPMERPIGRRDIKDAVKLYRLLKASGPFDIIHCHSSKAGALGRLTGFLFPHTAKVYTPHGFYALTPQASSIYSWIEWLLSWITDSIITVSQRETRLAKEKMRLPERKLTMILNGVDLGYPSDRAQARAAMGYNDSDFVVGFVGRLVDIKNPMRMAETFIQVARQMPNARLAVVGQGPLRQAMDAALAQAGLSDNVKFFDRHDARTIMAGFDCLVCTSNNESFGLAIIEALNAGVPVVTTPVGIADMAIIDGHSGYIADYSPHSLATNVLKLAALDASQRHHMALTCKNRAQQFNVDTMIDKTNALYLDLAKHRKAS